MSAADIFRALTLFIATALVVVGTGVSQIRLPNSQSRIYLYKFQAGDIKHDIKDIGCNKYAARFDAAYAFAIISCIVIGFAFILSLASLFVSAVGKMGKAAATGLAAFGFITTLISWAIVVGTFRATPCGFTNERSLYQIGARIDTGCALLICTTGVLLVSLIASAAGLVKETEESASFDIFATLRFVIVFVAALLVTLGTGLPQMKGDDGASSQFKVYLYQQTYDHYTFQLKDTCGALNTRMKAAYAFAILSCILIVLNLVAVALQFAKAGPAKIVSVGLSIASVVTTLIAWAIVVGTYYRDDVCSTGASFHNAGVSLSSGVILLIVTFILMIIDAIVGIASVVINPVVAAAANAKAEPTA